VQVFRVHSSDTQIFINGVRLKGVSNFSFSKNRETLDLRGLHSLDVDDRISQTIDSIEANLSWVLGNGIGDPFFDVGTSGVTSVEKFLIEAKDTVGTNILSGAYLNSYEVSAAVGDLVNGSISYEVDSHYWNTGKLSYSDQTQDSNTPFLPKSIVVLPSGVECGVSSSGMAVQSLNFTIPITRKVVKRVGSTIPKTRYPEFPIIGDLSFSVLKNTLTGMSGAVVLDKGSMSISMSDCGYNGDKTYFFPNCNLISFSESLDLEGNSTIDFNYKFSIDNNNFVS
jgi:hypothetical protein